MTFSDISRSLTCRSRVGPYNAFPQSSMALSHRITLIATSKYIICAAGGYNEYTVILCARGIGLFIRMYCSRPYVRYVCVRG